MQLYERVRELAKRKEHSVTALSSKLGMLQATFNGYLKESRQHKLWEILPDMLKLYPDISRDWLFFGEGDMYHQEKPISKEELLLLQNKIHELESELKQEHAINRQLTAKLLLSENNKNQSVM